MYDDISYHLDAMAFKNSVASHIAHDIFVGPLAMSKPLRKALDKMAAEEKIDLLADLEADIRRALAQ